MSRIERFLSPLLTSKEIKTPTLGDIEHALRNLIRPRFIYEDTAKLRDQAKFNQHEIDLFRLAMARYYTADRDTLSITIGDASKYPPTDLYATINDDHWGQEALPFDIVMTCQPDVLGLYINNYSDHNNRSSVCIFATPQPLGTNSPYSRMFPDWFDSQKPVRVIPASANSNIILIPRTTETTPEEIGLLPIDPIYLNGQKLFAYAASDWRPSGHPSHTKDGGKFTIPVFQRETVSAPQRI